MFSRGHHKTELTNLTKFQTLLYLHRVHNVLYVHMHAHVTSAISIACKDVLFIIVDPISYNVSKANQPSDLA